MKSIFFKAFAAVMLLSLIAGATGCKTTVKSTTTTKSSAAAKPLPPGQAKKVTGSQSAKEFAPGQQKKSINKKG